MLTLPSLIQTAFFKLKREMMNARIIATTQERLASQGVAAPVVLYTYRVVAKVIDQNTNPQTGIA